jgi:DsbC/DsbD-like thiol-disulfide interchange protein
VGPNHPAQVARIGPQPSGWLIGGQGFSLVAFFVDNLNVQKRLIRGSGGAISVAYNEVMNRSIAAAFFLSAAIAAQDLPATAAHTGVKKETAHLTLTTSVSPEAATPGTRVSLQVDVTPKAKMHVYSPEQQDYIPIALTLHAAPAFTAATPKYPTGEKLYLPLLKETQLVYSKPFRIVQDVTLSPTAVGASLTIKGTLRYQACDDTICYLPANLPVEWTLSIANR